MKLKNSIDFQNLIYQNDIFENKDFDFDNLELKIISFKSDWVQFHDCTFTCSKLSIANIFKNELKIEFRDCTFNCNVNIENCQIDSLSFINTRMIKSLKLFNGLSNEKKIELKSFIFKNENNKISENNITLSAYFSFVNVLFKKYFEFNNINNSKGIFSFSENIIGGDEFKHVSSCVFHLSHLSNVSFSDNVFNSYTNFKNSTFSFKKDNFINTGSHWNESKFERNDFNKVFWPL